MADELLGNLKNYQLQLQQVEAALTTDPENEDLQKLRHDLKEVLDLTQDLIKTQTGVDVPNTEPPDSAEADAGTSGETSTRSNKTSHNWNVGEKCMAMWSEDGGYYPAAIDEILEDGSCTVTFDTFGNTDVCQIQLLKPMDEDRKRGADDEGEGSAKKITKKDQVAAQREYKRKKAQKKAQKRVELEQAKEEEKNQWLAFNAKTFSKTHKGRVKKSIFASPDSVEGKVGVGTCGKSGNPMTAYHQNEKWKKQML